MCGIFGVIGTTEPKGVKNLRFWDRGPDQSGFESGGFGPLNFFLWHSRLNVSFGEGNRQPFLGILGSWFCFNGEIFNFDDLKNKFHPSAKTDTELLEFIVSKHLPSLPSIEGQYAFVRVNGKSRTVVLGRDRYGQKPLFYKQMRDQIVFGSVLQDVADYTGASLKDKKFVFSKFHIGGERDTCFEGVLRVLPGQVLEIGFNSNRHEFIVLNDHRPPIVSFEASDNEELDFRGELENSIDLCIKDLNNNFGISTSGGLDSSILAIVEDEKAEGRNVDHFGSVFEDGFGFSERSNLETLGRHLKRPINLIEYTKNDFERQTVCFADLLRSLGQPYPLFPGPQVLFYKEVRRKGVKVLLEGHGVDELYSTYNGAFKFGGNQSLLKLVLEEPRLAKVACGVLKNRIVSHWNSDPRVIQGKPVNMMMLTRCYQTIYGSLPKLLEIYDNLSAGCGVEVRNPYLNNDISNFLLGQKIISTKNMQSKPLFREFLNNVGLFQLAKGNKVGWQIGFWSQLNQKIYREMIFSSFRSKEIKDRLRKVYSEKNFTDYATQQRFLRDASYLAFADVYG